MGGHTSYVRYG